MLKIIKKKIMEIFLGFAIFAIKIAIKNIIFNFMEWQINFSVIVAQTVVKLNAKNLVKDKACRNNNVL